MVDFTDCVLRITQRFYRDRLIRAQGKNREHRGLVKGSCCRVGFEIIKSSKMTLIELQVHHVNVGVCDNFENLSIVNENELYDNLV